jgi:dUTP pyrophosphatase
MLKVVRYSDDATLPRRAHPEDAGWDLASAESLEIPAGEWRLVNTGIGITVPPGTYGRIAPRSGMSMKGIVVNAGVVDRSYTGLVKVLLHNLSHQPFAVAKGDRVAQLVLERIAADAELVEVTTLEQSERGDGGFGSTG